MIFCTSQKCGPLEIAGPGAAAPLAPPLMRPCIYGTVRGDRGNRPTRRFLNTNSFYIKYKCNFNITLLVVEYDYA